MNKLGSLHEKIIEHMVECPLESENTNHIIKALDLSQDKIYTYLQQRASAIRFVDARKIRRILERGLIVTLRNKIKSTNSLIDQLESEEPKTKLTASRKTDFHSSD